MTGPAPRLPPAQPVPVRRHASAPSESAEEPVRARSGPTSRPDQRERWYTPGEKKKKGQVRQSRGEAAWYLPDAEDRSRPDAAEYQDEYGDRHVRPSPKGKSGRTQVFDGSDY